MKKTIITCDKCKSDKIGGPNISFPFRKTTFSTTEIIYDIKARLLENPYDGHELPDPDICVECFKDVILLWADSIKSRRDK